MSPLDERISKEFTAMFDIPKGQDSEGNKESTLRVKIEGLSSEWWRAMSAMEIRTKRKRSGEW